MKKEQGRSCWNQDDLGKISSVLDEICVPLLPTGWRCGSVSPYIYDAKRWGLVQYLHIRNHMLHILVRGERLSNCHLHSPEIFTFMAAENLIKICGD